MTFTVASTTGGLGCREGASACPASTLTYDGTNYLIQRVLLQSDGQLEIWTDQFPITTKTLSDLTLNVGSVSLPFADATDNFGVLEWSNSGLSWSSGDSVTLTATAEVPEAPSVDSIAFNSAGTDGAFKTGDAVTATVTFSESVTVDTTDGTPQLTIKMGGADKVLDYSSGSPGTALVFSGYTVAANDEDTDGLSIEANKLDANGGTIQKTADTSVAAVLTHPAVAASANHKVDGVKPTLVTSGDNAPKTTLDGSQIILVFSEAIGGVDRTKITVKVGTTTVTTTAESINGTKVEITLTTALTTSETMVTVALDAEAVADVPGNGIAAVTATSVTRILPPGKPALTLAAKDQSIDATVVFTAHGTSNITKYQYRTKTTGSYGSWTDSTDDVSNTGGTFTIGSLTNGTEYTVQVRGVNSDGEGAESDAAMATPDAPPAVTSVAITSTPTTANTYIIGDEIEITVTFDKNLTVAGTQISGIPAYIQFLTDYAADTPGEPPDAVARGRRPERPDEDHPDLQRGHRHDRQHRDHGEEGRRGPDHRQRRDRLDGRDEGRGDVGYGAPEYRHQYHGGPGRGRGEGRARQRHRRRCSRRPSASRTTWRRRWRARRSNGTVVRGRLC